MQEECTQQDKCDQRFDEIIERLDKFEKRLFHDNGNKSMQSRINDNTLWCSVIKWFTITCAGGVLLGLVGFIFFVAQQIYKSGACN